MLKLRFPYLLFLGDVSDRAYAKTAFGLVYWARPLCVAQLRLPNCLIDLGLPDLSLEEAIRQKKIKSLVVGVAPIGGQVRGEWLNIFIKAASYGIDIVSGLHSRLSDIDGLKSVAYANGARIIDIRRPPNDIPIATGVKRAGQRLLTVGTDCAVGKKYAALAITQAMKTSGANADFRATGQTGIMIAGEGIALDAVVSDFIAGAAELISPPNVPDHWDIIEGQGSLFHPAYAGVSLGLLHGSQPDAIVVCWDPSRKCLLGFDNFAVPALQQCIDQYLSLGRLTNPNIRCVGVCLNTSLLSTKERSRLINTTAKEVCLPVIDPVLMETEEIIERIFDT